ncbi:MAG: DUF3006 domain-containing protein [Gemmatimonadaceae bacterium]
MTGASAPPQTDVTSTWVIDKIENGIASIEVDGGTMISIPRALLPKGAQEGDVLRANLALDPAEKAKRLAESAAQVAKGGTGGKGNITL